MNGLEGTETIKELWGQESKQNMGRALTKAGVVGLVVEGEVDSLGEGDGGTSQRGRKKRREDSGRYQDRRLQSEVQSALPRDVR